jgi:hypothetical protein
MGKLAKIIIGIVVALALFSGLFKVLGFLTRLTFGVIGVLASAVWRLIFNPIVLIAVIAILAWRLNTKSA